MIIIQGIKKYKINLILKTTRNEIILVFYNMNMSDTKPY